MAGKIDLIHTLLPVTQDEYNQALKSLVTERVYLNRAAAAEVTRAAAEEIIAIETAAAEESARKKPAATPSTRK